MTPDRCERLSPWEKVVRIQNRALFNIFDWPLIILSVKLGGDRQLASIDNDHLLTELRLYDTSRIVQKSSFVDILSYHIERKVRENLIADVFKVADLFEASS